MKTKLEELKEGDIITTKDSCIYKRFVIVANNGKFLTYYNVDRPYKYPEVHSYEEFSLPRGKKWSHIGEIKTVFFFFKKIHYYNQ